MDKKERKGQSNGTKKKLIRTKQESTRLKVIVTLAVLLVTALVYYIVDSGSYVATVEGNRIPRYAYQFFLSQQQSATEEKVGIYYKTAAEKEAFWLKTADGQNPWEEAKSKALDASKDYMIQIIKAQETGLKVNADIKSEVVSFIESTKSSMGFTTDKQFADYVETVFKITPDQLSKISENLMLIDKFKASYLSKEFKPEPITNEAVKAYYDEDPKQFDVADIRYIYMAKTDSEGKALPNDQIDAKKKKADEALNKIKQGDDINNVVTDYTEEEKNTASPEIPLGSASSISYVEGNKLSEWIFANKPGDSGVIETDTDIYVVKIEKRSGFDDAKTVVKSTMENEAKENFYDEALSKWSMDTQYNIIKNDRVYDSYSYK